ncbi:MAG: lipoyl(octanoyl) transferase LipB [Bacteroidales bacterium]
MERTVKFNDLGIIDYKEAWDKQEELFNQIVNEKKETRNNESTDEKAMNYLLFCEHPHVFTLGKSGQQNNLLINDEFLRKINATYYKINRGGDITYHGPGQIVGYPIIDLEQFDLQVKKYIYHLEEAIIQTLQHYNIEADRIESATGVWLDKDKPDKARKICAIGVRASKFVTMHGFAFNINTDLKYFDYINPCGFTNKGVTSLQKELGKTIDISETKEIVKENLRKIFNMNLKE